MVRAHESEDDEEIVSCHVVELSFNIQFNHFIILALLLVTGNIQDTIIIVSGLMFVKKIPTHCLISCCDNLM